MIFSLETLLQLCILLPIFATLFIVAFRRHQNLREAVSLATSLCVFYAVVTIYLGLDAGETIAVHWLQVLPGLSLSFSVEPLGMIFALIASFLWFVTIIYSIGYMRGHNEDHQTRFFCCFAIAIGSVMGVAFADNLFTLFIFYEVLTLSTYPLVTHAGTDAAKKVGGSTLAFYSVHRSHFFYLQYLAPG